MGARTGSATTTVRERVIAGLAALVLLVGLVRAASQDGNEALTSEPPDARPAPSTSAPQRTPDLPAPTATRQPVPAPTPTPAAPGLPSPLGSATPPTTTGADPAPPRSDPSTTAPATGPTAPPRPASPVLPAGVPLPDLGVGRAATRFIAANGSGNDCSRDKPCGSLEAGYRNAAPGEVVEILPGSYGMQLLRATQSKPPGQRPVLLRGSSAGKVEIAGITAEVAGLDISRVDVRGDVRTLVKAQDVRFDRLNVAGVLNLEGDRTVVMSSRVVPNPNRDAVQIRSNADGVRFLSNIVGPGSRTPDSSNHVDCLQVSGATNLLLQGNVIFGCPAAVFVKSDRGPITDLTIKDNVLQGCVVKTDVCDGFNAIQIRISKELRDVYVLTNTIDGGVTFDKDIPGLRVVRNIMTDFPGCLPGRLDNVFGKDREFPKAKPCTGATSATATKDVIRALTFPLRAQQPPNLRPSADCRCPGYGAPLL